MQDEKSAFDAPEQEGRSWFEKYFEVPTYEERTDIDRIEELLMRVVDSGIPELEHSNSHLEKLLQVCRESSGIRETSALVEELRDSDVLLLLGPRDGEGYAQPALAVDSQGRCMFPIYTAASQITVGKTPAGMEMVRVPFHAVSEMIHEAIETQDRFRCVKINPFTTNMELTPDAAEKIYKAEMERKRTGEKKPVDLLGLSHIQNEPVETLAAALNKETDPAKKGEILNQLIRELRHAEVILNIATAENGKASLMMSVHKETNVKVLPMYSNLEVAMNRIQLGTLRAVPFDEVVKICASTGEDVEGVQFHIQDGTLVLKRLIVQRVADVINREEERRKWAAEQRKEFMCRLKDVRGMTPDEKSERETLTAQAEELNRKAAAAKKRCEACEEEIRMLDQRIAEKKDYLSSLGALRLLEKKKTQNEIDELSGQKSRIAVLLEEEKKRCLSAQETAKKAEKDRDEYPANLAKKKAQDFALSCEVASSIGKNLFFGQYKQGKDVEPIEWLIKKREGTRLLLVSKYILEERIFYVGDWSMVFWEKSHIRKYLNKEFVSAAFDAEESKLIQETALPIEGGKEARYIKDRVFLLSEAEAREYFPSEKERQCMAKCKCTEKEHFVDGSFTCNWWLRNDGGSEDGLCVRYDGTVERLLDDNRVYAAALRPAMWIDLYPDV